MLRKDMGWLLWASATGKELGAGMDGFGAEGPKIGLPGCTISTLRRENSKGNIIPYLIQ